jgi:hypothetical protein
LESRIKGLPRLVRQPNFLRVPGQLRKKLPAVEGCSDYIRAEPWVVCQFDPHNRDEAHRRGTFVFTE